MKPAATELYKNTLDNLQAHLKLTRDSVDPDAKENAVRTIGKSRRIFFSGSGSSIPAAMMAGLYASGRYGFPARFATTSQVVSEEKLGPKDTVVLVSQGWNRSDALLVMNHVLKHGAKLIGLTGNKESPYPGKSDAVFYFYPPYQQERIFCRPSSVITGYALLMDLVMTAGGEKFSYGKAKNTVGMGLAESSKLPAADRYIILSSGEGLSSATNTCLALREGAGLWANVYEIESYGHGWYVPDQLNRVKGGSLHYILITHEKDKRIEFAVKRILPLFQKTGSSYEIWSTPGNAVYGNIQILARTAATVYGLIKKSGYDMNNPPGKEENRYFHDLLLPKAK